MLFCSGVILATAPPDWSPALYDEGYLLIPSFLTGSSSSSGVWTGYLPISYLISESLMVGVLIKKVFFASTPNFFLANFVFVFNVVCVLRNRNGLAPFLLLSSVTFRVCLLSNDIVLPASLFRLRASEA